MEVVYDMKGDKLELEQIEGIGPKTKELLEKSQLRIAILE